MRVERAAATGFCYGVRRAIDILERVARERGGVETLGAVVHNQQVLKRLEKMGIRLARGVDDIKGDAVAIGAHGVSPRVEGELRARHIAIVDTTCPFVHRAQIAARRLARSGFFVIIYGHAEHAEVRGVLGWAEGRGLAALDVGVISTLDPLPRRLGILSQTTQIPACFTDFVKEVVGIALVKDSELRIIDTICHDIRERQAAALELARRVDVMLVIGGHNSANTSRLAELCAAVTKTYLVETAGEIQPSWFPGQSHVGVTAGASTAEESISEVMLRLETLGKSRG